MDKKVTIVLPSYNGDRFIRESIDSCLKQTYKNLELIIVEDGSDCLGKIVDSYDDKRLIYTRNEENIKISGSLNKGFSLSSGDYLTWTSDDNIYDKNAVERMVQELENDKRVDFVYADFREIDERGEVIRSVETRPSKTLDEVNYIGLCFLYKREIYEKIGGYDPDCFLAEDYEYWLRIYHSGFRMKRIQDFLYKVRMHEKCLTCMFDPAHIEEQAQKVRDKYISEDKRFFQHGRASFYKAEINTAKNFINKTIRLNPFNPGAWRLWFLLYLDPGLIEIIRTVKRKLLK